jgi:hypothetical protein
LTVAAGGDDAGGGFTFAMFSGCGCVGIALSRITSNAVEYQKNGMNTIKSKQ